MLCSQCLQLPAPPAKVRSSGQPHSPYRQLAQLRAQQPVRASLAPRANTQRHKDASAKLSASTSCSFRSVAFGCILGTSPQPMSSRVRVHNSEEDIVIVTEVEVEVEEVAEEGIAKLNPMFSGQFASVLKEALERQGGSGTLYDGPIQSEPPRQERRPSAMEEVLFAALQNSRRTLHQLEASEKALAESIAREKKQFERLHFCLKKAVSDGAYLNTIEQLLEEKRSELCELRDYDADR